MPDKPNSLGRMPIAMISIHIPIDISPFNSDEELEEVLKEAVKQVTFPEDARVVANVAFVPDPREQTQILNVQDGFYKDPFAPQ